MGFGFGEGSLGGTNGALVCLVGWCLLACLFVLKANKVLVLFDTKVRNWSFFLLLYNIPGRTDNITAKCFLSAFKAPVEIFQEGYRAFTRQRSELCPRGSFRHPSMSSPLSTDEVS